MNKFKESSTVELKKSTAELKQAIEDICAFVVTFNKQINAKEPTRETGRLKVPENSVEQVRRKF